MQRIHIYLTGDYMLFYLIGIKGSAMSALAKILAREGHIVKGVDINEDFYTIKDNESIKIETFSSMRLKSSYYYIIGNAYRNHSVANYVTRMHFYYLYYPDFLKYHYKNKKWLCVSGTHGKTTTTKMMSSFLIDTISLIGDGSFSYGTKDYFLVEACEYRDTFLNYSPHISLILNVDFDHVDYFKTKENYRNSFKKFVDKSYICVCNGDAFEYRNSNMITYGIEETNDIVFKYNNGTVTIFNSLFNIPIKGIKYAYNFVGAYIVSKLLNVSDRDIKEKLLSFKMPARRYQKIISDHQVIILDYAHHPSEINAFYESVKEEYPNWKKICIFEPHTVSRLACFLDDFLVELANFDACYLYSLFSSIREPHNIVLEKKLYQRLDFQVYNERVEKDLLKEKAIICFLGAGDIDKAFNKYIKSKNCRN